MTSVPNNGFFAMGTRCHAVLPGLEDDDAEIIFRYIREEVARIEGKLSRFREESDIARINAKAGTEPVRVEKEMFRILTACANYHAKTEGCFDITLRPVLQYWKDNADGDRDTALEIRSRLGTDKMILNPKDRTVSFRNNSLELDLGGFGKGYALEKVNEMLLRFGITSGFLTMGESSVLTLGNHPAGDHWKVGIKNYLAPDEAIHTFHMRYGSVSTSSNFYVDDEGKLVNHRHVIDPFTGVPVEELVTVSVFSNTALLAEVMSTAMLVMEENKIEELVEDYRDLCVLKVIYEPDGVQKKIWGGDGK
ncbi:MAG: FAD:protein FMN transferase [Balneolaceae bacterium]|nr:MAG: FAD:protein FMN transferase [Balneolaceae bacterium]